MLPSHATPASASPAPASTPESTPRKTSRFVQREQATTPAAAGKSATTRRPPRLTLPTYQRRAQDVQRGPGASRAPPLSLAARAVIALRSRQPPSRRASRRRAAARWPRSSARGERQRSTGSCAGKGARRAIHAEFAAPTDASVENDGFSRDGEVAGRQPTDALARAASLPNGQLVELGRRRMRHRIGRRVRHCFGARARTSRNVSGKGEIAGRRERVSEGRVGFRTTNSAGGTVRTNRDDPAIDVVIAFHRNRSPVCALRDHVISTVRQYLDLNRRPVAAAHQLTIEEGAQRAALALHIDG